MRRATVIGVVAIVVVAGLWFAAGRGQPQSADHSHGLQIPRTTHALATVPPLEEAWSGQGRLAVPSEPGESTAPEIEATHQEETVEAAADESQTPIPTEEGGATERRSIPVSGVLVIPDGWPNGLPVVSAHRIGDRTGNDIETGLLSDPEESNGCAEYQWSLALPEGDSYEFWSEDPPHVIEMQVSAPLKGVRVEVPPPMHLFVRVVDADTNENVGVESLSWSARRPDGSRGRSSWRSEWRAESGVYDLTCVAGEVRVSCNAMMQGYAPQHASVHVGPGPTSMTFELVKVASVRVELVGSVSSAHIGDVPVLEIWKRLVVREVGGQGKALDFWRTESSGYVTVYVTNAGRYRLDLSDLPPGLLTYDAAIADLTPGKTADVAIRVTREP